MPRSRTPEMPQEPAEKTPANPSSLSHPLVRHLRRCFRRQQLDEEGFRVAHEHPHLALRVGPASFDRACRIWDSVLSGLEEANHAVTIDKDGTFVTIGGERLQLMLRERKTRVHNDPATIEALKKNLGRHAYVPEWGFRPTGRLAFLIENEWLDARTTWEDAERKRLEDMVASIVSGIAKAGEAKRVRKLEQERAAAERRMREQREWEEERRRREELERVNELIDQAKAWRQACLIREFVAAMKAAGKATDDWVTRALAHADRIDPSLASSLIT